MESKKVGLGEREKNLLQKHWMTLKRDVRISDIVDNLIVEGVLKPATWEDLKRKHSIEKERTEEFLLYLQRKPSKCFEIFREALRENGYEHLADKLDMREVREEGKQKTPKLQNSIRKNSVDAAHFDGLSEVKKTLKELLEKDEQKSAEIAALKQEFEQKFTNNYQQTKKELTKLKAALKRKEDEIRQQELKNTDLSKQNRKLEESLKREKTNTEEMQERLTKLEHENTLLTARSQSANTYSLIAISQDRETSSDGMTLRRQPTGLSGEETEMSRLVDQRTALEEEIKRKQKDLEIATKKLNTAYTKSADSKVCVIQ